MRTVALFTLAGVLLFFACERIPLSEQVSACHARGGKYLMHPENEPDLEQAGSPHCVIVPEAKKRF